METEKVLAPLFEHLDRALPDVIYICPFHPYQQIHSLFSLNQLELVFRHEIKSHDSSLCLERLSQLLCTIRLSNFFFFCLLSFLYTNYANYFLSGFAHSLHQSEMPSESLLHCLFTAHPNSQSQKAILIFSNSYFKRPPHHLLPYSQM